MRSAASPLLERHQIFHSRDPEETRAFLGRKEYRFDAEHRQVRQLDTRINCVYMSGMYIAYLQYGSLRVVLSPGPARADHLIQLPVSGHLAASVGGEDIDCNSGRAAIASPARERCCFASSPDSARVQLALRGDALSGQLGVLLGEPPEAPLDFAPVLDLSNGYGQTLARYTLMAVAALEQSDSALLDPVTMRRFEEFIMTGLLLSHPSNYSEALRRRARPIASRDVKRAIDYMEAHLGSAVTLGAIVEASGVAGRTLLKHFRDIQGISPMGYLRNARFQQARQMLMRASPEDSITEIAMKWGFSHLGRFSTEYRNRFGERPSETRRRGMRPAPAMANNSKGSAEDVL